MRRSPIRYLAVLVVYLLLTLLMTYPVVTRLSTHLVGFGDDAWVHYWNGWWVKRALTEGSSLYSTRLLFYPQTTSLVYHNFGWTNIAGWLVLEPLVGGIAAYNLVHLINVTLCAFAMFILAHYLLKSTGAAFVAGLVYGYWPYRLTDYGHPNMASTQWLPLALLGVILLIREGGQFRDALLTGLFLALTGLARWQMLVPAGIAIGLYLIFSFVTERARWSWRVVGMMTLAVLVMTLLIIVPVSPLVRDLTTSDMTDSLYMKEAAGTQTDLLSYVVPPINHPLAPLFDRLEYVRWRIGRTLSDPVRIPYSPFLGCTVLALALIASALRWQEARLWAVLALLAFVLALGPVLRFNRRFYPAVPMPYRLVGWSLPLRLMRNPHRFNSLLALPIAVLAGYGALAIQDKLADRRSILLWCALSALVLFDYLSLPAATIPAHIPAFYRALGDRPGDFAIAGLPGDRGSAEYYMFYQTAHERPLLTGHISRLPSNALDFVDAVPMTDGIYLDGGINKPPDLSRQLSLLADAGFRYIVLHKGLASTMQLTEWRSYLLMSPHYEDDEVVVYSTTPIVGVDCPLPHKLGAGLGLIKADLSTDTIRPDAVLELRAIWGATAPPGENLQVEVSLVDEDGNVGQAQRFEISPDWPTGEWPANAIVREQYALQVEPWLKSGKQRVQIGLVHKEDTNPVGERVAIGEVTMEAPQRSFAEPTMSQTVGATFGDALRLLGYDLETTNEGVQVTLHWQALRRMDVGYKFFLHLYEAESGKLVAQTDVMPRDWTYPTTWWEVEEIVSDEIDLSLEEIAPGRYSLGVGVYHPDTGERLTISGIPAEFTARRGRLTLSEEVVR